MPKILQIDYGDDELQGWEFLKDDGEIVPLLKTNHDEHGWDGMNAVSRAFNVLAVAAGWEIEEVEAHDRPYWED